MDEPALEATRDDRAHGAGAGLDLMQTPGETNVMSDPRMREANTMIPVYGQLPFVPERASGCDIFTKDGRRILDLYGGHAVAALGYGHPRLLKAIQEQSNKLLFQSNSVALEVRARAAESLVRVAPPGLERLFFVNSGAEANENALRMACITTGRKKILALTHGFHGRTAAAAAVTWNSEKWYGFPSKPFATDFIPRDDVDAAKAMINSDIAAVIVEPVQGVAGAYDVSTGFLETLREETQRHGVVLIADEVQSGIGRCGHYFAVQAHRIQPDIITSAKALGGGIPCGAVMCTHALAAHFGPGDLGSTFGGGPVAAAAIAATIEAIEAEGLLANVRRCEAQIREQCVVGPVTRIQGMGLLLGLVCDRPAVEVRNALLEHDILTGTSSDPDVLRILAPLVLETGHIDHLAHALASIAPVAS
ncbi:MAG: aminotransferase class III-fold pyridoxal phosphate-dependent enzyme [Gammaproteobacteria bacterium]|nr:aminotransferase class III-fold pyridoxal phosphate-dependent enzyme [Gammaproteobacteria bacterium]NNC57288.1 aspartate aminotransferase family protein [Woeseiaceae bacterium]NNL52191.1 aspartate aminotransferase family protein [Woeseiaceae bacterium]